MTTELDALPPRSARCRRCCSARPALFGERPLLRDRAARAGRHARRGAEPRPRAPRALAAGRRAARRPRRADVRQPHRVPRGLPRLRLDRRRRRCRSTPRRWGRRSSTSSPTAGAAAGDRGGFARAPADRRPRRARRSQAIWVVGAADAPPAAHRPASPASPYPAGARADRRRQPVQPGDPLAILYTSGTTGPAKGVLCPHAQYHWWGANSARILGVGADDVLCTTLPLFHINALNTYAQAALTGCAGGVRAALLGLGLLAGDARLRRDGGLPARRDGADPAGAARRRRASARTACASGSAPACRPRPARRSCERTGVRLLEGYGSTETNFVIATAPDSPRGGVMGWLRPGFEARVADEDDAELPAGEAGELLLRADEPYRLRERLLQHAREDRRGLAQPVVPHRRPRGARGRRRLPLRRPHQGRDPPARREHLLLRGRAGAAEPSRRGRRARSTRCAPSWPRTR